MGLLVGAAIAIFIFNPIYVRELERHNGTPPPEARLPSAMLGALLLPIGLFVFAWTCQPGVHWSVSIIFSSFFGAGMILVFLSCMNYLVDTYLFYAASALAANSVLRSLFGAIFPLFTRQMYDALGINWASSIPAFLSLACAPIPCVYRRRALTRSYIFYRYGLKLRSMSNFAPDLRPSPEQEQEDNAVIRRMRSDCSVV